jgi:hypothetical protein
MSEQAPRVQNEMENVSIKDKTKSKREQFRQNMQLTATQQARIPQRHQMQLQMQDQREQAQLIHDKETVEYLKYRQLICDPKYKET